MLVYIATHAQTSANINSAAKLQVTNVVGSNPYTLTVNVSDDLSRFTFTDFVVGDSVYLIDGSDLLIYRINSKLTSPNRIVVTDVNNTGINPPTGQGAIMKTTVNSKLPTYISGLRDDLRSMIMNRLSQQIDAKLLDAKQITRYVGNSFPSFIPLVGEPIEAMGLEIPYPKYKWNGTAWTLQANSDLTVTKTLTTNTIVNSNGTNAIIGPTTNTTAGLFLPDEKATLGDALLKSSSGTVGAVYTFLSDKQPIGITTNSVGRIATPTLVSITNEAALLEIDLKATNAVEINKITALSQLDVTRKVGYEAVLINAIDTTVLKKVDATKWRVDVTRRSTQPRDTIVGGNAISFRNATWENTSFSINNNSSVNYVLQNGKWIPQKGFINIEDVGGRENTNSADALNNGIAKTTSLRIQSGTYNIEKRITITKDSIEIIGDDNGQSILKWTGGFGKMFNIKAKNVKFKNIVFDANNTEVYGSLIYICETSVVTFEKCTFKNINGTHLNGFNNITNNQYAIQQANNDITLNLVNCDFQNIKNENLVNTAGVGFVGAYLFLDSTYTTLPQTKPCYLNALNCTFADIRTVLNAGLGEATRISMDDADGMRFYSENTAMKVYAKIDGCTFLNVSKRAVKVSDLEGVSITNCTVIADNLPYPMTTIIKVSEGGVIKNLRVKTNITPYSIIQSHSGNNISIDGVQANKADYFYLFSPFTVNDIIKNVSVKNVILDSLYNEFFYQETKPDSVLNFLYENIIANGMKSTTRCFSTPVSRNVDGERSIVARNLSFKNGYVEFNQGSIVDNVTIFVDNKNFGTTIGRSVVRDTSRSLTDCYINIEDILPTFKTQGDAFYYQGISKNGNLENLNLAVNDTIGKRIGNYDAVFNQRDSRINNVNYDGIGRLTLGTFGGTTTAKHNVFTNISRKKRDITPSVAFLDAYRIDSSQFQISDFSNYLGAYTISFNVNCKDNAVTIGTTKSQGPIFEAGLRNVEKRFVSKVISTTQTTVGINTTTPQYKLDIDANTGSTGNPLRLRGLIAGSPLDSILSSDLGVIRRISIAQILQAAAYSIATGTASTDNLTSTDYIKTYLSGSATTTINFPSASVNNGKTYVLSSKKTTIALTATSGTVTDITGTVVTAILTGVSANFISNGTNWIMYSMGTN